MRLNEQKVLRSGEGENKKRLARTFVSQVSRSFGNEPLLGRLELFSQYISQEFLRYSANRRRRVSSHRSLKCFVS